MSSCPCGSGKDFTKCCEPFLQGAAVPATAEALMRSRYTAYTLEQMEYIENTHAPETRDSLDMEATCAWAKESTWLGLRILSTEAGGPQDSEGTVEFTARYRSHGEDFRHHEVSSFVKHDGSWYFLDGYTPTKTVVRDMPKVGRNEPCPCGSGKKYKNCCG